MTEILTLWFHVDTFLNRPLSGDWVRAGLSGVRALHLMALAAMVWELARLTIRALWPPRHRGHPIDDPRHLLSFTVIPFMLAGAGLLLQVSLAFVLQDYLASDRLRATPWLFCLNGFFAWGFIGVAIIASRIRQRITALIPPRRKPRDTPTRAPPLTV